MTDQVHPPDLIQTKATTKAKVVVLPAVKEQIFTAFVREKQGRRRLAQTCGAGAVDEVLREACLDMQAQGATPRFRVDGFGKPIRREVLAMPARVAKVAA